MDKIVDPLEIKSYADFIARIRCQALPQRTIMRTFYFCDLCSYYEECMRMRELQHSLIKEYERIKESE